jgi:hypothetical protein
VNRVFPRRQPEYEAGDKGRTLTSDLDLFPIEMVLASSVRSHMTDSGVVPHRVDGSGERFQVPNKETVTMKTKFLIASLVLATAAGAFAATPADKDVDVVAELQALKAEVARLRAENGDSWLNQRRAEEVKSLVHEVLADADTRASLAGEGMTGLQQAFLPGQRGRQVPPQRLGTDADPLHRFSDSEEQRRLPRCR